MHLANKYITACGGTINISDKVSSHLAAHPTVVEHLKSAIGKLTLPAHAGKIECEIDLGRMVGRSGVVTTFPLRLEEPALFAFRKNRKFPSRVAAPGELGEETSKIVIIARPGLVGGQYELITAWIGSLAQKEPWDSNICDAQEFEKSVKFWSSVALVYEPATMGPIFDSTWKEILCAAKSPFI